MAPALWHWSGAVFVRPLFSSLCRLRWHVHALSTLGMSTTSVSNSVFIGASIIGRSRNFSDGSYHGRLSVIPPSTACAINLPISSPCRGRQLELGRRLHRKAGRFFAFEDTIDVISGAWKRFAQIDAVANEAALTSTNQKMGRLRAGHAAPRARNIPATTCSRQGDIVGIA